MNVTLQYFARARDLAGTPQETVALPSGSTLLQLKATLLELHPSLEPLAPSLLFAIGTDYAPLDTKLVDGHTIACFPPVSGG
ncbi:MAG: MoaD/ThiS family protein [Planctomycetaceae bacterium]